MLSDAIAGALERTVATPLAMQLCEILRRLIVDGVLKPGEKLPPSRELASDLALGRNTVVEAYARLASEGYLVARTGVGSFVADEPPQYEMEQGAASRTSAAQLPAEISSRAAAVLREAAIDEGRAFAPCVPDLTQLRFDVWQKLLAKCWRQARFCDTQYAAPGGHARLRAAIAAHVTLTRQVRCRAEQIVIVNGAQHGLDLCARFLAEPGDRVWVENPCYPGARRAFGAAGLTMVPIEVDAEGLAPRDEDWLQRPPRLIYVTPSHQFPTGVEMSVTRRAALLAGAARHGCLIIEDDYDGEFRLGGRPIPSLQGLDDAARVIYVGTFSKVLFPALRLGYLVLPETICEQFALATAPHARGPASHSAGAGGIHRARPLRVPHPAHAYDVRGAPPDPRRNLAARTWHSRSIVRHADGNARRS